MKIKPSTKSKCQQSKQYECTSICAYQLALFSMIIWHAAGYEKHAVIKKFSQAYSNLFISSMNHRWAHSTHFD